MLPPDTASFSGWLSEVDDDVDAREEEESMIELERPGEEKKKRREANTVVKSGISLDSVLESDGEWSSEAVAALKFS